MGESKQQGKSTPMIHEKNVETVFLFKGVEVWYNRTS